MGKRASLPNNVGYVTNETYLASEYIIFKGSLPNPFTKSMQ